MKIIIPPDKEKAKSLRNMAKITEERLNQTNKEKYPSNTLIDYYEIIRKLMEALSAINGIKIKGEGAHYELINYICDNYEFSESDKLFIQEIRTFRNQISYEGFNVNKNYIESNSNKIEVIIDKLNTKLNEKE